MKNRTKLGYIFFLNREIMDNLHFLNMFQYFNSFYNYIKYKYIKCNLLHFPMTFVLRFGQGRDVLLHVGVRVCIQGTVD